MFIVTAKLSKSKLVGIVVGAGVLMIALVLLIGRGSWQTASAQPDSAPSPKGVSDNSERVSFLSGYGWEVENEAVEFQEVLIPDTFDEVLSGYNQIQKQQGFDLTKYQGKRVMRYTYLVTNYPNTNENVHANLLIYKGTVIGGDVCSTSMDGFMHGLSLVA